MQSYRKSNYIDVGILKKLKIKCEILYFHVAQIKKVWTFNAKKKYPLLKNIFEGIIDDKLDSKQRRIP